MKSAKQDNKPGHVTTGDIFDDLGFSPAETMEARIKSEILHAVVQHAGVHGYSQAELAEVLKVHQPDVSNLLRGKISKFSITRLIQFAGRLNLEASIHVEAPKAGKPISSLKASAAKPAKQQRALLGV
jgi:predicted XRE-type DNA-binding protein